MACSQTCFDLWFALVSRRIKKQRYFCFGRAGDGILTVRFTYRAGITRIFGAGDWRKGKAIYERENQGRE